MTTFAYCLDPVIHDLRKLLLIPKKGEQVSYNKGAWTITYEYTSILFATSASQYDLSAALHISPNAF